MHTALCEVLDLEHPVVQAPIGSATCPELAAAVADAGALGHLAVTWRSLDGTREVIRETREATDGAWLGTRFVATEEANVAEAYRERVALAESTDTVRTDLFDGGWPGRDHRVLRNSTVERWEAAGRPEPGDRPGEGDQVGAYPGGHPVERYGDDLPVAGATGDVGAWALYAGQSAGLTDDVRPAGEVVATLVTEAEAALERVC